MSIRYLWDRCTEEEAAYLLASLTLVLCMLASIVSSQLELHLTALTFFLPGTLFFYGFTKFIEGIWISAQKSILVKVANYFLIAVGSGFAVALSGTLVNWALQAPSSAFPHTRAMAAILCVPGILMFALPFAFVLASPLLAFVSMTNGLPPNLKEIFSAQNITRRNGAEITAVFRVIVTFVLVGASFTMWNLTGPYSDWAAGVTRWYAYSFEAEQISYCHLSEKERIAYISGEYVVRASPQADDYSFKMGLCNSPLDKAKETR